MNIAVYCAARETDNKSIIDKTNELGKYLAENNHTLVYGGGKTGLMGLVASACLENKGNVIGVIPDVPLILERVKPGLTTYYYTKDMASRRSKMIELSDVFIALPGGYGTLDELSEVITNIGLKTIHGKCIVYNMDGYYDFLIKQFETYYETGFADKEGFKDIYFASDIKGIDAILKK